MPKILDVPLNWRLTPLSLKDTPCRGAAQGAEGSPKMTRGHARCHKSASIRVKGYEAGRTNFALRWKRASRPDRERPARWPAVVVGRSVPWWGSGLLSAPGTEAGYCATSTLRP